jgi:hypothetical protein
MSKIDEKLTHKEKKQDGRKKNGGSRKNTGGKRDGSGRKKFQPTEIERNQVAAMAGFGVPYYQICTLVGDGISIETLRKYFSEELTVGKGRANLQIGKKIYQKAIAGDTKALIWWSKSQMGWSEIQKLEHTSPDGSMSNNNFTRQEIEEELKNRGLPLKIFDE